MNWTLKEEKETTRLYVQEKTGNECTTELIYTDKMDNRWWGFADLFRIPYLRIAFAKQVADLYTTGLTGEDILNWCSKEKEILKAVRQNPAKEPEAYEKLYALIIEKEALVKNTVDPLQQHLALCTIYVLGEEEKIDYFNMQEVGTKMQQWKLDPDAVGFFLNWHTGHIQNFISNYNTVSKIALNSSLLKEGSEQQPSV